MCHLVYVLVNFFRAKSSGKNAVFVCCKRIPFNGLVIEGVVKIIMVSIGKFQ